MDYHGNCHSKPFSLGKYSSNSFRRNETGWPCKLPEDDVKGVFMSAWASIQIKPISDFIFFKAVAVPSTLPIAKLYLIFCYN